MKTNQSTTNIAVNLIKGLATLFVLSQLAGCFNAGGTGGPAYGNNGVTGTTVENVTEESAAEESVTEESVTEENVTEESVTEESAAEESTAEESVTEDEISTAKVSLNWTAPVAREDESPISMSEIAGYRVYYGTAQGEYAQQLDVNDAYIDELVLDVVAGTYYLVITTIDVDGRESAFSDVVILNV